MSPVQQDGEAQFTPQQNVQHGMGQSKSSRRRRRKRKNKGADAQQAAQSGGDQPIASIQGSAASQTAQPQSFQAAAGQQQNSPSGGGKRWKKKFRDRDRQRSQENPGNVASGSNGGGFSNNGGGYRDRDTHQPGNSSGGFKRKGGKQQQRGPRSFVGPMDHSYRAINGNFADTPPSTMDSHNGNYQGRSNGHGGARYQSDSQPIDYSQGRAIPIPADAPTKIFFFIEDLFFIAKIQETARKLGVKVAFVKNEKDAVAALTAGAEEDRPSLIVFDLNNANAKPLTLIPKLKAKLKRSTSIVGFLSHLQGDLKAKAVEAGCDTVMPRAAFSQNLPNLLRRYGMEEEEEPNFNQ
jgi:CheY-like chemotaxis protein